MTHTDWTACTATSKTFFNCDDGQSEKCDTVAVTSGQRKMNLVEQSKKIKRKKHLLKPFSFFYTNLQKQVEKLNSQHQSDHQKNTSFFFSERGNMTARHGK